MQKNWSKNISVIAAFILINGFSVSVYSQTLEEARQVFSSGNPEKARQICRSVLADGYDPDVAVYMGRTYAWENRFDSARVVISEVIQRFPEYPDALDALADVEYWSGNPVKAVGYCDRAIKKDANSAYFHLKKAEILHNSGMSEKSVVTLEEFLKKNPQNEAAAEKLKEYRQNFMKNEVRLIYTIDLFDKAFDRDPWQIQAWSYERKTKAGPVIARVNYANRFEKTGFQIEADAYPRLNGSNYLYINYGFSQSSVFPVHRGGLEWYHNFSNGFEGSAGMRLLNFDPSNVEIYTASLGKYAGNYWLSLRSFVTPETEKTSVTGVLLVRRYFSGSKNYAGLKLGYGNSPDELRNLIDSSQKLSLKTQWLRLEFNHIFAHTWSFGAGATLGREERLPDTFSGYYSFEFSLSKMF